ncbi:HNH endonuclease [Hymenobacter sp. 102]|uniref:HNH endonuclease n=1 Tax=Hymenobacter sp. 102 TaxID=3403152 RepID=UPI003CEDCE44
MKIRHITRDIDPETGDVRHFRAGYTDRELVRAGVITRGPTKGQRARRKRRKREHYQDCPPRPLFHTRTPDIEPEERARLKNEVFQAARWRCQACGHAIRRHLTLDHIIPLSRGGGWHRENLQCLCQHCNQAKADKMPYDLAA